MKELIVGGYACLVGGNAKDNWKILEESTTTDTFFHLSSFPSCYVILRCEFPDISLIMECASVCLENTKYKNLREVYVDYTHVRNVKKGDVIGEVEYLSHRKVKKIKVNKF